MVTLTVPVCQPGWEEMEILRDIWGNLRVNLKSNNSECQKVSLGGSPTIVTLIQMYILHNNCIYCCGLHNRLRPFVKHTKFLRFGQFDKPKWYPYHLSIFHDWPLWYCLLTCNFPVDKKSSKYPKNHIFLRSIEKQQKLKRLSQLTYSNWHWLSYVFPSEPQTGSGWRGQSELQHFPGWATVIFTVLSFSLQFACFWCCEEQNFELFF